MRRLRERGDSGASRYASQGLTSLLTETAQFPRVFGQKALLGGKRSLTITIAGILVLANLFDLTAIASLGSAVGLVVFMLVSFAGFRLRAETGSQVWIILLGMAITGFVLLLFALDVLENEPETFAAIAVIGVLALLLDAAWTWYRDNRLKAEPGTEAN